LVCQVEVFKDYPMSLLNSLQKRPANEPELVIIRLVSPD
jgi:hypothetical protein